MLVRVLQILDGDGKRIYAESEYGSFHCNYCGPLKDVNDTFYAEIDISEKARGGCSFFASAEDGYAVLEEGQKLSLCCLVEAHDDDDVITLRLGRSLFLVGYTGEHAGDVLAEGAWYTLTISNTSITLYDIGL